MTLSHDTMDSLSDVTADMIMAVMGVDKIAYVKPVTDRFGEMEYRVFAADGTELACFASMEEATFCIRKHNLTPASIQ